MAKVFLINPPSQALGPGNKRMTRVLYPPPPGGLAMIAASLLRAGHQVMVLDLVVEPQPLERVVEVVMRWGADAVGFSVLGAAFFATQELARALKAARPSLLLFAGNALPSEYPGWFLKQIPELDAVVVGEGEESVVELVNAGGSGVVPGVAMQAREPGAYPPRGQIEDLDSLPFPAWELFPYRKYYASPQLLFRSKPTLGVLQSRGCPWKCGYCAQNYLWPTVRKRSIAHVVSEMRRNVTDLGIDHFGFYDSIFPLKPEYGPQLRDEIARQGLAGRVRMFCETRVDMVWEESFRALKEAGMHLVFLGIETDSDVVLKGQGKIKGRGYDARQAVETLKAVGLRSYGLFVLGLPEETPSDRARTKSFACSLDLDVASFGIYTQYAGSPSARRDPEISPEMLTGTNWELDGALADAQRSMMRAFYLRPSVVLRHLWRREITVDRLLRGAWAMLGSGAH
ncbi:MAG: B12-binding domain-containing radical SAM protein [Myxococcota bacterium]